MNRARNTLEYTMDVTGKPDAVFPLLCPVREYEWIDIWDCRLVFSASGKAELGCVFQTWFPQDGPDDTWVVSRYEPSQDIEFVRINALRAIHYSIRLQGAAGGRSTWVWRQTLTGLNDEGDALVIAIKPEAFAEKMAILERKLNHYLDTGHMLKA